MSHNRVGFAAAVLAQIETVLRHFLAHEDSFRRGAYWSVTVLTNFSLVPNQNYERSNDFGVGNCDKVVLLSND